MIEFNCPKCDAQLKIADQHAGKLGKCKTCGEKVRIPSIESVEVLDEPPPLPKVAVSNIDKKKQNPVATGCGCLIIGFLLLIAIGSCGKKNSDYSTTSTTSTSKDWVETGEFGVVCIGAGQSITCAFNQADYDKMHEYLMAKDKTGFNQMLLSGKLGTLNHGDKVRMIRPGVFTDRVRPTSGPMAQYECYVTPEFICKE